MTTVHLTLSEALLGFSRVVVAHLDGRGIKVSSPKGKIVKPSDSIVFRGEGMPTLNGSGKGDLYILFEIEMPTESWLASVDQVVRAGYHACLTSLMITFSQTLGKLLP